MPEVEIPSDFEVDDTDDTSVAAGGGVVSLSGGIDDRDRADVYIGLQFDGYHEYTNLTEAKPDIKFLFYQPPTFDFTRLIVYRPQSYSDIDITVRPSLF